MNLSAPPLTIGIDGRALGVGAGSGRYVAELCRVLDQELPEAKFVVFSQRPIKLPVDNFRWSQHVDRSSLPGFVAYLLRTGRIAKQRGVDVFWGPSNFLPLDLPRKIPALLTVLDLVHRLHPESMSINNRLSFALAFRSSLRRADLISAISTGTARRLSEFGYRPAELVIRPAAAPHFRPPEAGAIAAMRQQLGIAPPYLLSVSTLEPRKNLVSLLDAYLHLLATGEIGATALVLAGRPGWKNQALQARIAAAQADGRQILCLGHVDEDWLPALYAGAEAVVMPSLYEGFGLPVLEARRCGARVIATDTPELREAGGEAAIYCSPDRDGICQALRQLKAAGSSPAGLSTDYPSWDEEGSKLAQALRRLGSASTS